MPANLGLSRGMSYSGPRPAATAAGRTNAAAVGARLEGLRAQRRSSLPSTPRAKPTSTVSDSAKNLLNNGDYANDFAREAKRINTKRGLTKAQRKAQLHRGDVRRRVDSGDLTGDAAARATELAQQATRRGLTRSQRVGLADASETLLGAAEGDSGETDAVSKFERNLLKFFDS